MAARFELNGISFSGPTYKVGLMLSLAGEPFDYVHIDMMSGEHKKPAHLSRQRYGQVPLLVDRNNGRHLCQSAAILEYLADVLGKFGGATLSIGCSRRYSIVHPRNATLRSCSRLGTTVSNKTIAVICSWRTPRNRQSCTDAGSRSACRR